MEKYIVDRQIERERNIYSTLPTYTRTDKCGLLGGAGVGRMKSSSMAPKCGWLQLLIECIYIVYVCMYIVIIVFIRFTFIVKCTIRQVKSLSMKYYCVYRKALTIKHCNCRSLFSLLLYVLLYHHHHHLFYINANSGNIGKLLDCDRRYERVLS